MTTKQHTDRVIIRAFKNEETNRYKDENGQYYLDAFLPDCSANSGNLMCYGRVSTAFNGFCHSEASLEYYQSTQKVDYGTPEVKALVNDLISIGYNVRLMKRLTRPFGGWAK